MRTGYANLPLHGGQAPRWLFNRMVKLAREMTIFVVAEHGPDEMLRRLSDPYWFQAFGCVLGFDWHSSGVTTTVGGAIKEGVKDLQDELGFYVAGGKGATSRKTPAEIERYCEKCSANASALAYASRLSAKVDSAAVQDGYQLYHHNFFFVRSGAWAVVQQGMNTDNKYARRYHWLSDMVAEFTCEPHAAVCCDSRGECLNMVARESAGARNASTVISREGPDKVTRELNKISNLTLPRRHEVNLSDVSGRHFHKILVSTYEKQPADFEALLAMPGVGPKTIRALSLVAELVYGEQPSFRDPARFSFAHGGKDGYPYPVDRTTYDQTIEVLEKCIRKGKIDLSERTAALRRLRDFANQGSGVKR